MKRGRRNAKMRFLYAVLAVMFAVLIVFTIAELRLRPLIVSSAQSKARLFAVGVINSTVGNVIDSVSDSAGFVKVQYGDSGVKSIETNVAATSLLRTQSVNIIGDKLSDIGQMTFKLPVGNLLGSSFLIGRGFPVAIKLVPIGDVNAELYSEFSEAGINQTLHRIYLRVRVTMNMFVASDTVKLEVSDDVLVAETVIVGAVPDAYTAINRYEIDEDEENDLNDYAATLP